MLFINKLNDFFLLLLDSFSYIGPLLLGDFLWVVEYFFLHVVGV